MQVAKIDSMFSGYFCCSWDVCAPGWQHRECSKTCQARLRLLVVHEDMAEILIEDIFFLHLFLILTLFWRPTKMSAGVIPLEINAVGIVRLSWCWWETNGEDILVSSQNSHVHQGAGRHGWVDADEKELKADELHMALNKRLMKAAKGVIPVQRRDCLSIQKHSKSRPL